MSLAVCRLVVLWSRDYARLINFGHTYLSLRVGVRMCTCATQIRVDHRNGTLQFGSQQLESDSVRTHIQSLASRLTKAVAMMQPPVTETDVEARRHAAMQVALDTLQEANIKANARKVRGSEALRR